MRLALQGIASHEDSDALHINQHQPWRLLTCPSTMQSRKCASCSGTYKLALNITSRCKSAVGLLLTRANALA